MNRVPFIFLMTFHINGLTNEMDGQATFLRDGKLTPVDTLSEPEFIEFAPLGRLEADVTSGGLSTSPWTFEGQLQEFTNKTLRYPGHFEWLRAFKELGLFSEEAIQINENQVVPREVYHALLEPKISASEIRDVCVIRVVGYGKKDGEETTVTIDRLALCHDDGLPGARPCPSGRHIDGSRCTSSRVYASST
jgi:lysine 6-dehydrogenase